jgi:iron complex transport system substrate-binding protein
MSAHACGQDTEPLRHRGRKRKPLWLSEPLCLCVLLLSLFNPAQAYEVRDDAGRTTRFDAAPQRIVSLLPSLTETVCELGACARLVGVDRYSNWPTSVRALPEVGGGLDPNIEAVVALRPDVVLVATSTRAADRLRALGLKVVALEPKTGADVRRVVHKLGQLLGAPDAERVLRAIDAGVAAAAQSVPAGARGQRVYFEVSPAPHAAGQSSFMGELLAQLGLRNIVGPEFGPFPKLNPEAVVRADPDLIMVGEASAAALRQRPGWQGIRAVRAQRVCVFDAVERDVLIRPGPRMAEAARWMADCAARFGAPALGAAP